MKKTLILLTFSIALTLYGNCQGIVAEDLWGNKIEFEKLISAEKTIIIQPVSPANCGYCLIDGYFVEKNYFENNLKNGGQNFYQCLFNPQLDVFAYTKHYRDFKTTVLTYPPSLHEFHLDGFPTLLAFRSGEQIIKLPEGSLWPYAGQYQKLKKILWENHDPQLIPVSDIHFAMSNIFENSNMTARVIVPGGDSVRYKRYENFLKRGSNGYVRYFDQLSDEDKLCHLYFEGKFTRELYRLLKNTGIPLRFVGDSVLGIGNYRLPLDSIGVSACFPNPFNLQTYFILNVQGQHVQRRYYENYVDFTIYKDSDTASGSDVLIHGFFAKYPGKSWIFADSLFFTSPDLKKYCAGVCRIPRAIPSIRHEKKIESPVIRSDSLGTHYTLGNNGSRFPSASIDEEGIVWIAWDEGGDILLNSVNRPGKQFRSSVECDNSDSYLPLLATTGNLVWIFYLNNRDGFYRLVGKSFDRIRLSDEILISDCEPFDVFSADVTGDKRGNVVLAWSVWKANNRYLFSRAIKNKSLEPIKPIKTLQSKGMGDYTNAWYPSLSVDENHRVWGAWNQHYPATLGVCAGNLDGDAVSVTRLEDDMDRSENGGYPNALTDQSGKRWIFYESSGWDILNDQSQKIKASGFDSETGKWSLPVILTMDTITQMNQTPASAVDSTGKIWVVWSGRGATPDKNWGLYISRFNGLFWSFPKLITDDNISSRAPKIVIGKDGTIWIAYHSGTGEEMKIKVLKTSQDKLFPDKTE